MSALVGLRGVAGKTDATGPITISQADYSVRPQKGDQIWVFIQVCVGGSTGTTAWPATTTELSISNLAAPDWFELNDLINNYVADNAATAQNLGGHIYYYTGVFHRSATGTTADNVTWISNPQAGDNITCVNICHVVLAGQNILSEPVWADGSSATLYYNGASRPDLYNQYGPYAGNGALYDPVLAPGQNNLQNYDYVGTTNCETNTVVTDPATWENNGGVLYAPYDGIAPTPGLNLLCAFMGDSTFGTAVSYSNLSPTMTLLYNSTNGFVVAGEFVDSPGAGASRKLTWGSTRRSLCVAIRSATTTRSSMSSVGTSLISNNRTF